MADHTTQIIQEVTQSAIAIGTVAGAFGMAFVLIARGSPPSEMPGWIEILLGAVAGFYFAQRSGSSAVAAATEGPVAAMKELAGHGGPRWNDPGRPGPTTGVKP